MRRSGCKFYSKICSDGRLYVGGWTINEVIPNPVPEGYVALEDVPENIGDGHNYIWDGETLTFHPLVEPQEECAAKSEESDSET